MKHFAYKFLYELDYRQVGNTNWIVKKEHMNKRLAHLHYQTIQRAIKLQMEKDSASS